MNVNWLSKSCRRWRRDIALRASGLLPEERGDPLEAHLADCARCRHYREELGRLAVGLRSLSQPSPDLEPSAGLRARWMRAVRTAPQPDALSGAVGAALAAGRGFARRPVWAGLAGVWLLTLFFRLSAPAVDESSSTGPMPAPRELYLALCDPDWPRPGGTEETTDPGADERKPPLKPRSQQPPRVKAA